MTQPNSHQPPVTMTPQQALELVAEVRVPTQQFLSWIAALGGMPTQFGADLWVAMNGALSAAIQEAAAKHADGPPA